MLRPPTSTSPTSSLTTTDYTLLVIGPPQSGKSVLISKALKSWFLQRERQLTLGTHGPNNAELRGVGRFAHVGSGTSGNEETVEVIEVSSQELLMAGDRWPGIIAKGSDGDTIADIDHVHKTGKGRIIDAVVVVYDSADSESWQVAKVLLGEWTLPIPSAH